MLSRLLASLRKLLGLTSEDVLFTLSVDGYQPVTGVLSPLDPLSLWYWIPPDQLRGEIEYQDTEYLTRACTNSNEFQRCPGVVILGEEINHTYSRSVKWIKQIQYFSADLISLQRFGVHFPELGEASRNQVDAEFTYFYRNGIMLCNGDSGFGGATPKNNYMKRERGAEDPVVDAYRWCTTNSVRPARYLDNPIVTNKNGEQVMAVDSWIEDDLPLDVIQDPTYALFMRDIYPIMQAAGTDPKLLETFTDEVFAVSTARDQITFHYDAEILQDPRVAWATDQHLMGDVSKFRTLDDTPYPFITRADQPAYYPTRYLQGYAGDKKTLYYTVNP